MDDATAPSGRDPNPRRPAGDDADPTPYRLDDLARAAGVASTTVRLYQNRGLLDRPRLVGRVGYYGPAHLARLRLIARLQDEGHSLNGIGRLLHSWQEGVGLAHVVGLERELDGLLQGADAVVLSPVDLAARFPAGVLTPDAMRAAMSLGIVALTVDGDVRVADGRFLTAGASLAHLGIPVDAILAEWAELTATMATVAERFVRVFETHLLNDGLAGGRADGSPAVAAPDGLADQLRTLRAAAGHVVLAALDAALAVAGRERLGQFLDPAPRPPDDTRPSATHGASAAQVREQQ